MQMVCTIVHFNICRLRLYVTTALVCLTDPVGDHTCAAVAEVFAVIFRWRHCSARGRLALPLHIPEQVNHISTFQKSLLVPLVFNAEAHVLFAQIVF